MCRHTHTHTHSLAPRHGQTFSCPPGNTDKRARPPVCGHRRQGPEAVAPCSSGRAGLPPAATCHLSLWKEAGDVVGIRCQFHRHPALGLQPHWGPAAAWLLQRSCGGAWERAPWPQSAHVWDAEPRGSRSESLLPSVPAGRPRGTRLLRFLQLPICPNQPVPTNPKIESLAET